MVLGLTIALAVSIGVVALLTSALVIILSLRNRRRNRANQRRRTIDPTASNPAHVVDILPSGSWAGGGPRLANARAPGSDMRVASLRPDGSWEISRPATGSFHPSSLSDIDLESQVHKLAEAKKHVTSSYSSDLSQDDADIVPPPPYTWVEHSPLQNVASTGE